MPEQIKVHESTLFSFQLLAKVKEMLCRGDSSKTVLEFIEYMEDTDNSRGAMLVSVYPDKLKAWKITTVEDLEKDEIKKDYKTY